VWLLRDGVDCRWEASELRTKARNRKGWLYDMIDLLASALRGRSLCGFLVIDYCSKPALH
jgi:hypothetical protein